MSWTVFPWAIRCRLRRRHEWGAWRAEPHATLVEFSRCRCGVERTRRKGIIRGIAPGWQSARWALDREARGGTR